MMEKCLRFCINCGATVLKKEDLIDRLCYDCYKLKNPPVILKQEPSIYLCKECLAIKINNEWLKTSPADFYEDCNRLLKEDASTYFEIAPNINVRFELIEYTDFEDLFHFNTIPFKLILNGKFLNIFEVNDIQQYTAKIKLGICDNCKAYKLNLTKAKIRIIAKKRKITDLEIKKILKIFEKCASTFKDPDFYILTPLISKYELIFRVNSIDFAKEIESQFKNTFGAVIRESRKFRTPGKTDYRKRNLHILIKLLPFFSGDVIKLDNELLYVISTQNNSIVCFNFKTKEIKKFLPKKLMNAETYIANSLLEKFIISAIYEDIIQVMDLKSCQIFEITNEPNFIVIKEGAEISGFKEGEQLYLIPPSIQKTDDEIE